MCAKVNSILITLDVIDAKAAVNDALFGILDAATFRAFNTRYLELVSYSTSDKILINKVTAEATVTDIWKYRNKEVRWIVNDAKLSLAADLFASVAPFPSELTSKNGDAE